MPTVKFTNALKRYFPDLKDTAAKEISIAAILSEMETSYPGLRSYLLDEQGNLRKHVNIFIDGTMITNRAALNFTIDEKSEVFIIQALSGG
ncbi:MAG: MoaD/ThiS family protein [Chitinophagaceae bacterium]|nr:MoaD/ThiS family protein [Chitinophagaceae bacterium]